MCFYFDDCRNVTKGQHDSRTNHGAAIVKKSHINIISLTAILGGQTEAKAIGFKYLDLETTECPIKF